MTTAINAIAMPTSGRANPSAVHTSALLTHAEPMIPTPTSTIDHRKNRPSESVSAAIIIAGAMKSSCQPSVSTAAHAICSAP